MVPLDASDKPWIGNFPKDMMLPHYRTAIWTLRGQFFTSVREALIISSCRLRPASSALKYMDSGIRRNDGTGINQTFLRFNYRTGFEHLFC